MWQLNTTFAFLFGSMGHLSNNSPPKILVNTSYGLLQGTSSVSRNDRTIYEFLGVPYAKPPVGDLRFQAPVGPDSWEGIRDATSTRSRCLQIHLLSRVIFGEEDCLTLNIYTHQYITGNPTNVSLELKPVVFYIHGGFFMHGSGNIYKGKYFLDEDIVLVTLNYRVGALGFLNLENNEIRGNMGLKDQVMALKWVKDNIDNFGGDPNKVTIFGESAGAVCVHLHMLSPLSKGLFHRAISQSGTALNFWAVKNSPLKQAKSFAKKIGCDMESPREIADCLRNKTGVQIVQGHRDAAYILTHPMAMFGPTVETMSENSSSVFLSDTPFNIIRSGEITKVPWMTGVNSEEGLIYAAPMLRNNTVRKEINKNWTKWIPTIFNFDEEPQKKSIANKMREFYLGNVTTEISMKNLDNFTRFLSDRTFFEGLHNSAILQSHRSGAPLYLFLYAYKGTFSFGRVGFQMTYFVPTIADVMMTSGWSWIKSNVFKMKLKHYGVCHGDELPLLFNLPMQPIHKKKSTFGKDYEMSEYLIKLFSSFATNGKPFEESWLPVNVTSEGDESNDISLQVMRLDRGNQSRIMIEEPFSQRSEFWKKLNLKPCKIEGNDTTLT